MQSSTPYTHITLYPLNYHAKNTPKTDIKETQVIENQQLGFLQSRGDRIRTCDTLVPNQVRYRAALHPESISFLKCGCKGMHFISNMQVLQVLFYYILLNEDFLKHLNAFFHLVDGVCCHKREPDQRVLWSTCRWNDGIDKHTVVEGKFGD